jgi:tetratricopeptide (TPR) repeat protein
VSTGRLLLARSLESHKTWSGTGGGQVLGAALGAQPSDGQKPDREKLERDARAEVVAQFVAIVAPRKEYGEVDFETDSSMPQLDGGIGWATRGEWKRAQDQFNEGIKAAENNPGVSSKILGKAYLDAGLSYVFAGDYDAGIKLIEKAYDLTQDTKMLDRVDYAKQLQADAAKLATQAPPPPDGSGQ